MYLNLIFPTIVGVQNDFLTESEKDCIIKNCYSLTDKISLQHERWGSGENSPLNSFDSYMLHKDNDFNILFSKMNFLVDQFAKTNEDPGEYLCSHAWFNIYNDSAYQEPHYHHMATYSVVYYAKAPENSGQIVFMNPFHSEATEGSINFGSTDFWNYIPQENTAIIFRSNIAHYVLQGKNDQDRISIAANYSLSPQSYKKLTGLHE